MKSKSDRKKANKLYCYVDESGQDTEGNFFVVSVVVTGENRDEVSVLCEQLEKVSGKKKDKWGRAKHERRMRYIRHVFADDRMRGLLRFRVFRSTKDHDGSTIKAVVSAVNFPSKGKVVVSVVYIDGLSKTKRQEYGARLRQEGLSIRRIRGVARDEANALTRLADAVAGFVRDALEGKSGEIGILFKKAKREGSLVEVS